MRFDPESARGYMDAIEYLRSCPDGMRILRENMHADGLAMINRANVLWEQCIVLRVTCNSMVSGNGLPWNEGGVR